MNTWKVILATMVIFGAGVVTGGLVVRLANGPGKVRQPRNVALTNQSPQNVLPAQMLRMDFLRRIQSELSLTPQQHERIEKIIREGQEKSRKTWESVAPEMRKELQSVHEKIRAELTPEQRRRFEQILKTAPRSGRGEEGQPRPPRRDFQPRPGGPPPPPPSGEPDNPPPAGTEPPESQ